MKKYLLGLVLLGLTSIGYADYNWASWYNQNPTIPGNLTVGGTLGVTGLSTLGSLSITGNATINELSLTNGCTVGTTLRVVGTSTFQSFFPISNRNFLFAPIAYVTKGAIYGGHPLSTNPTIFLHSNSDPSTNFYEWFSITNNGVNSILSSTGTGNGFVFRPNNTDVNNSTWTATGLALSGYVKTGSKTLAQLKVYTPGAVGEIWHCSDTTPASIFMSTGTTAFGFIKFSGGPTE